MERLGRVIGAPVVRWRRLGGGLAAETTLLSLEDGRKVVMKRYSAAVVEWACLSLAAAVEVPSPDPIAVDVRGEWFGDGVPALVMSWIPGTTLLRPKSLVHWLGQLAGTLAAIHDADTSAVSDGPGRTALMRPVGWALTAASLAAMGSSRLVHAGTEALVSLTPPSMAREVLLHNDFHPGNLLWQGQRLSGVLDWAYTRLGPRACDVAYCRIDIAMLHGLRAADSFAAAYRAETGADLEDLPLWDLRHALRGIAWGKQWVGGYVEQGLADLSAGLAIRRIRAFATRALQRVS